MEKLEIVGFEPLDEQALIQITGGDDGGAAFANFAGKVVGWAAVGAAAGCGNVIPLVNAIAKNIQ